MNPHRPTHILMLSMFLAVAGCQAQATVVAPTAAPPATTSLPPESTPSPVPPKDIAGRYLRGGSANNVLDLLVDGSYYHDSYNGLQAGTYTLEGSQLTVKETMGSCGGSAGIYTASLEKDGLKLTAVDDKCFDRKTFLGTVAFQKLPTQDAYLNVAWTSPVPDMNKMNVDGQGNIYVTIYSYPGGFAKYDGNGKLIQTWPLHNPSDATGIAVDSQGNIYVNGWQNADIQKYDPTGKFIKSWQVDGGKVGPTAMGFDGQDHLYVVLHREHDHYVEKYDAQGHLLGTWAGHGTGDGEISAGANSGPEDLAVDAEGDTYVPDRDKNRVHKYDANGKYLFTLGGDGLKDFSEPDPVAVDGQGNVYIADSTNTLWKFDRDGKPLGRWFMPFGGGIAVDKDGNLIIAGWVLAKAAFPAR